eukprot:gene27798-40193_t
MRGVPFNGTAVARRVSPPPGGGGAAASPAASSEPSATVAPGAFAGLPADAKGRPPARWLAKVVSCFTVWRPVGGRPAAAFPEQ